MKILLALLFTLTGCSESFYSGHYQFDFNKMERMRQEACPIKKNEDLATQYECLKLGSQKNNPIDQHNLATYYLNSKDIHTKQEALPLFQKAAEQGLPKAQHDLSLMYWQGDGVQKNNKLAEKWAKEAIANKMIAANTTLGLIESENGNFEKAFELYQIAAETGFAPAQYNVGVVYHNGEGVKPDLKEAVKWYELAAEQGWQPAIVVLVDIYDRGSPDIPKDETKKQYWQSKLSGQ